jgi:hypothetical protein
LATHRYRSDAGSLTLFDCVDKAVPDHCRRAIRFVLAKSPRP